MLTGADADGDGGLDYGELANIDPDLYIGVLGLKDAESMLRRFDKNRDGQSTRTAPRADQGAHTQAEGGDDRDEERAVNSWRPGCCGRTGKVHGVAEGVARQGRGAQPKGFRKRYFDTVEDEEMAFFRVRVEELHDALLRTGRVKTPTSSA